MFLLFFGRCLEIAKKKEAAMNEEITDKEIRVIGSDGEQLGIMSASFFLAISKHLSLIHIFERDYFISVYSQQFSHGTRFILIYSAPKRVNSCFHNYILLSVEKL